MTAWSFPQHAGFRCAERLFIAAAAGWLLLVAAGCRAGSAAADGGRMPTTQEARKDTESAILDVVAYYPTPIRWIWTEDRTRVRGLIPGAVYLMGPNGRGVFGDGNIHPKILVRDRTEPNPQRQWTLVKEWDFTPQDLYPLRTKKAFAQGYGYMLPLSWGDLDLSNREIRVVIGYVRTDGAPAPRSSVKDLLVPAKGG